MGIRSRSYAFSKNDKVFIVDKVKQHALWKNDKFWKEAYTDSVQQEILKYPPVKKWHSDQEQQEAGRREEQIIFSQLAAWTHNMKEFGTANEKIIKFLDSRGLKAESIAVLKMTLQLNTQPNVDQDDKKQNDEQEEEVVGDKNDANSSEMLMTPTSSVGLL